MSLTSGIYKCVDCGRDFTRKELNRNFRCKECRIKIVSDNMQQLMRHEGPLYDKWREKVKEAASRL